ncbi:MAG: dihydropteroate synthase [Candidatus Omnitrophota bacterium]|jgi:5-methyltetrahydrofolate--homocysteine methyltransferase
MFIIGEKINSTRSSIKEMFKTRNAGLILNLVRSQLAAGASAIDVNCAVTTGSELEDMDWVISVLQSEIPDINLCIDSPNFLALEKGLSAYKGKGELIINSITGEESRIKNILPLALKYGAKLIALTMTEEGMPDTAEGRFEIARKISDRVKRDGFKEENLYFDPLIRPISTEPNQAREFLKSIPMIKSLGAVKTICGLSNVSFGLPDRSLINSVFLSMAMQNGLDAAIMDPLDNKVMSGFYASGALMGADEYCQAYIKAFRDGLLV